MSNSPRCIRSWSAPLASLLIWIPLLSFALSYLYGGNFSSGWLIAGAMMSIALFCGLLVFKEILASLQSSRSYAWCQRLLTPAAGHKIQERPQSDFWECTGSLLDASFSESRRAILGLRSNEVSSNRRRKPTRDRPLSREFAATPAYRHRERAQIHSDALAVIRQSFEPSCSV